MINAKGFQNDSISAWGEYLITKKSDTTNICNDNPIIYFSLATSIIDAANNITEYRASLELIRLKSLAFYYLTTTAVANETSLANCLRSSGTDFGTKFNFDSFEYLNSRRLARMELCYLSTQDERDIEASIARALVWINKIGIERGALDMHTSLVHMYLPAPYGERE
jgi:hypothetical protein